MLRKSDCHFDVLVAGAGLMGSAAARHLAQAGAKVALVGPKEPNDKGSHNGVFASHYDQARITRRLDSSLVWSRLASASIDRYRDIEKAAKRRFFHPVGALMAGPETGAEANFILNTSRIGQDENIAFESLRDDALKARFPYFDFPAGILGLYEPNDAGWINPREHIAAEIACATQSDTVLFDTEVTEINDIGGHVMAICHDGAKITATKAIIACGAFSKAAGLLPNPISLDVFARTIAFVEIDPQETQRLNGMPSLVYRPPSQTDGPYVLPPVVYPDGKTYIKIGGDPHDVLLDTTADVKNWFKTDGDAETGEYLVNLLTKLMPGLRYRSTSTDSCVTSFTPTGRPLIHPQTDRVFALTGGNGASAKCADEIGRLAAQLVQDGTIPEDGYQAGFTP
ncbi:FAD-binding oxidoreductase [Octadecabacter sp.]|nr:FAD-binding oxidoreductase [Octadecabacter sp.]